jgi:hypothetical protein
MKNQSGKDEKTEQRYGKDSHASGEITRPMFWKLLAQRPVLGQPDSLTKGLVLNFLRPRCGRFAGKTRQTNKIDGPDFSVMYRDAINFTAIRAHHVIYHCGQSVCGLVRPVDHPNRAAQGARRRVIRVYKTRLPHDWKLTSWASA